VGNFLGGETSIAATTVAEEAREMGEKDINLKPDSGLQLATGIIPCGNTWIHPPNEPNVCHSED